jgi:hypothetical protein
VAAVGPEERWVLFSDTETSQGNIFTAGAIDLKVDHTKQTYNGQDCVGDCREVGINLILNGGFETPDLASGTWAIYPDASQTSWSVESGAGLEIQNYAAGTPHSGEQLAELDSNNSSVVYQEFVTVPGDNYRFSFWYSPRPSRGPGDNTVGAAVKVVSDDSVILSDTIGAAAVGSGDTSWVQYVYNFIAVDASTKIVFSDFEPVTRLVATSMMCQSKCLNAETAHLPTVVPVISGMRVISGKGIPSGISLM